LPDEQLVSSSHYPKILNLEPLLEQTFCSASTKMDIDNRRPLQPAQAVGLISFSALNASPLFHTAKVIAAIRRAIVTLANSGRSPLSTSSAYHALNGPHLEAVRAALLKTYFNVRL
jgi:hypothetical protein